MKIGKKLILILIILSLLALILFCSGIYFLIKDIKKNSEDFLVKKREIFVLRAKIENLENFEKNYGNLEPDLEKISNLFVDPKVPIDFIKFLETTASSSGISIKIAFASSRAVSKESWPFLGFQLSLGGSMPNFFKFLEKMETAPYLIEIQNSSVQKLSEKKLLTKEFSGFSLDDVTANLVIKVFTY